MAVGKPPSPLVRRLADATRTWFTALRKAHGKEHFYFFALYTTEDGTYVTPTATTEEALAATVAKYRDRDSKRARADEELVRDLRFCAPDSPYHAIDDDAFGTFVARSRRAGAELHQACFDALRILDDEGLFGRGAARAKLIVNVVYGDMSDERWLAHAEGLNPKKAIAAALPFLRLHLPSGEVTPWGTKAYQLTALSLSADAKLVAYTGSGGEIGVFDTTTRAPVLAKRLRGPLHQGAHWGSVISPDGTKLYLGDETEIGILPVPKGEYTKLAKTKKPSELAITRDGALLAASSWSAPLTVYDTAKARIVWKLAGIGKVALAFSTDGAKLAVAQGAQGKTKASVRVFDARSGKAGWTTNLGIRSDVSIAWAPDGRTLLVAASELFAPPERAATVTTLAYHDVKTGKVTATIPCESLVGAIAISPSGSRIGICAHAALVAIDHDGNVLARGTGGQETLDTCVFVGEERLLAVGRDVNSGPGILELHIPD